MPGPYVLGEESAAWVRAQSSKPNRTESSAARTPGAQPYVFEIYLAYTPGGGIGARSGTTLGSATCDMYHVLPDGTISDSGRNETVCNIAEVAIEGSSYILCMSVYGGGFIALPPAITDLQVDGTDLELRRNAGWSVWHAGEDCT